MTTNHESMKREVLAMTLTGPTLAETVGLTFAQARDLAERGCALAADGQLDEAAELFEGLLLLNPKDSANWAALGTVYQKQGQLPDAELAYGRSLALDGDNVIALANLGELQVKRGVASGHALVKRAAAVDQRCESGAGKRAKAMLMVSEVLKKHARG